MISGLVQMWANWLESVMLVFTLDFGEFYKALALHYYLNWLWFRSGGWECNGDSGGSEHQRRKNLSSFEEHVDEGKQKLWVVELYSRSEGESGWTSQRKE